MDALKARLSKCFQIVFPDLPEQAIPDASQVTLEEWDSVAAITLVNVIEEEFNIQMDYDVLADLTSFGLIYEYLQKEIAKAS
jgi:acyl carrier protein